jgi:hypothetical protein
VNEKKEMLRIESLNFRGRSFSVIGFLEIYRGVGSWGHFLPFTNITRLPTMASAAPAWANPDGSPMQQQQQQQQQTIISNEDVNNIMLAPFSTLDEPVIETIMRDVRAVGTKLKVVMLPLDRNAPFGYTGLTSQEPEPTENLGENQKKVIDQLKDWDLWYVFCFRRSASS